MTIPLLTYGGLDLNDHVTYFLLPGFDPGEKLKSWDEQPKYTGGVVQTNVSEAALIQMTVPLEIQAATEAALADAVAAINDLVDAGAQYLGYTPLGGAAVSYSCVHSQRLSYPRLNSAVVGGWTSVIFAPWRLP